jgi:hypothetical protein
VLEDDAHGTHHGGQRGESDGRQIVELGIGVERRRPPHGWDAFCGSSNDFLRPTKCGLMLAYFSSRGRSGNVD